MHLCGLQGQFGGCCQVTQALVKTVSYVETMWNQMVPKYLGEELHNLSIDKSKLQQVRKL